MKAIAYHIRHRFFISKSDVRQSATFDPAQTKSADFPDRDFVEFHRFHSYEKAFH